MSAGQGLPTDLSPEQRQVVETWGQGMAVTAGAGSGKTTTLVLKCAELLGRDPEARFAAVSFTEKSASDLREKLSTRIADLGGHWITTIHGLCASILREHPREAGFDGEESVLSESETQLLWERAIEQLWEDGTEPGIQGALERMLDRESRDMLWKLLKRVRELSPLGALEALQAPTGTGGEAEDSAALARLAGFVLERYDRLKRRRGALDFADLEQGADRALEHRSVRAAYQKRFALVLVDEFQDTNPVQARIILRFVKEDLSNLCVVGDPKQSIYRFRDADVEVFKEFCARLPVQVSLTWNFRSRPGVLAFVNRACSAVFEDSALGYQPLVPKRPAGEGAPVVRLDLREPRELAEWILAETARGTPLQDMALLLRKIRGNERWLKALTAAGVPIALGSGGMFWEDPRAREMVAFLKWWGEPAHAFSGAVFLRAPWVGVPDAVLDGWVKRDPTWVEPFLSSTHPLARALAPLRGKVLRPGELLLALLIDEKAEEELGSALLGLWHRAEELSSRGLDYFGVVVELGLAVEESRREREVPPPRNEGQLSVLTVHGSKGLEFPHVILVDLGGKAKAASSPALFWDRERGAFLVRKDRDGERVKDPELESWKKLESGKEINESKRVFYVALTRARERLILACPELPEGYEGKYAEKSPEKIYTEDFWRGWLEASGALRVALHETLRVSRSASPEPVSTSSIGALGRAPVAVPGAVSAPPAEKKSTAEKLFPLSRPRHSVTEWNLLARCPRAYEWTYVRPRVGHVDFESDWLPTSPDSAAEGISQRELGTEVHACLERGDYGALAELERKAGPGRFNASSVRDWARTSLYMRGHPEGKAWAELSFEAPVGSEVLVGSMDRVVETEGRFCVLDFKITRHGKTSEALLEAYGTQMELYRWALGRLTGTEVSAIAARIVNFSEEGVHEVEVPGARPGVGDEQWVSKLAKQAVKIIAARESEGEAAPARPGAACRACRFLRQCDAGMAAVAAGN